MLCMWCCSAYQLSELVCMGGFNNTRQEVLWEGFTLELDETKYPWGTLYELEAETVRLCDGTSNSLNSPGFAGFAAVVTWSQGYENFYSCFKLVD